MGRIKIKTIDITCLEWFDKSAGNSYFAGTVVVNYKMKGEKTFVLPFQYGYNDHYQYKGMKLLAENGVIDGYEIEGHQSAPWRYCNEHGIILRTVKHENCTKAQLKAITENE